MSKESKTIYFDSPGPQNTEDVFRAAKERADELGIRDIVVASTSGKTGVRASEIFKGYNLVVVSHCTGWKAPGVQEMSEENMKTIIANGAKVLTTIHAFTGVDRGIKKHFGTAMPLEILAQGLRMFGQGTKVAIEVSLMAADAGLISMDKDIVTIAGTNHGADTALVIKPVHSIRIFDLVVREIIAKPRMV